MNAKYNQLQWSLNSTVLYRSEVNQTLQMSQTVLINENYFQLRFVGKKGTNIASHSTEALDLQEFKNTTDFLHTF